MELLGRMRFMGCVCNSSPFIISISAKSANVSSGKCRPQASLGVALVGVPEFLFGSI
jgi:hypothetical protein